MDGDDEVKMYIWNNPMFTVGTGKPKLIIAVV
jgi:hypothetical protein